MLRGIKKDPSTDEDTQSLEILMKDGQKEDVEMFSVPKDGLTVPTGANTNPSLLDLEGRDDDGDDVNTRTINEKTFISYPDPNEYMWGGTFYDNLDVDGRPKFNMLKRNIEYAAPRLSTRGMFSTDQDDDESKGIFESEGGININFKPSVQNQSTGDIDFQEAEDKIKPTKKFGTWDGVFASCLLNIFGVIMFLRLPWVVGQAGIPLAIAIICLSGIVVVLTTLSMSAIATNGQVEEGGAYFMISRSLGPEVGGAVGVLFSIGMSVAVSMYVIGFCETMVEGGLEITGDPLNDVRISGFVILTVCLIMVLIGIGWVIKLQLILLFVLTMSIIFFFVGAFAKSPIVDKDLVFMDGFSDNTFTENLKPEYRKFSGIDNDFFTVFGVFFPAVTGIMAGANISGDLKDPSVNIPVGTLWAVGVSMITYILMAILCGVIAKRGDVDGENGLHNNILIMQDMSLFGWLILVGIYAATFTSALASLVGAPRILLSFAKDNLISCFQPFAVTAKDGCGTPGNPIRGYFVSYVIAFGCVAIGELNAVAPLITMFFMITYALINFSVFLLSIGKSPGWRPSFKYSHWSTGLLGFLLCMGIMFLIEYRYAFVALLVAAAIWAYIHYSEQDISWGSAQEARNHNDAINKMLKLRKDATHVKNYRPSYLVMTGRPEERPHLVYFGNCLRKASHSLVVYGHVSIGSYLQNIQQYRDRHLGGFLQSGSATFPKKVPKVKGFFEAVIASSLQEGAQMHTQLAGLGRLKPNVIVLGFKENWKERLVLEAIVDTEGKTNSDAGTEAFLMGTKKDLLKNQKKETQLSEYVGVIKNAFVMRLGVMICRNLQKASWEAKSIYEFNETVDFEKGIGTIDIWWLVDDGGLTVLIPHLLSNFKFFKSPNNTPIRLMTVVEDEAQWSLPLITMQKMIKQFRLNMEVIAVETKGKAAKAAHVRDYEAACGKNIGDLQRPKVAKRWIRVGELIRKKSQSAKFVFITMPVPHHDTEAQEYIALLDWLSKDLPPTVMMRGANQNVLTFYL